MSNYNNIKDKGFDRRSKDELRAICSKGGKKSGETRRKKANFKKSLNWLLTAKLDEKTELFMLLEALGMDGTVENAMSAAMIQKALNGDVKAYEVIAKIAGQDAKNEARIEFIRTEIEKLRVEIREREAPEKRVEEKVERLFDAINDALDK